MPNLRLRCKPQLYSLPNLPPRSRETINSPRYPRKRYRLHWLARLSTLPWPVLIEIIRRMRRGVTDKAIAAWLVLLPNRGECARLSQETFRTYLRVLREEVRRRDRYRTQHLRRLDRAQRALEREAALTAVSSRIDEAYASAGASTPPSPSVGPPPSGPTPPGPPAGDGPNDPPRSPSSVLAGTETTASTVPDRGPQLVAKIKELLALDDQHEIAKLVELKQACRADRICSFEDKMPVTIEQAGKELERLMRMCKTTQEIGRKAKQSEEFEPIKDGELKQAATGLSEPATDFDHAVDQLNPAQYDRTLTLTRILSEWFKLKDKENSKEWAAFKETVKSPESHA